MTSTSTQAPPDLPETSNLAFYAMAVAAGIAVANIYYNQPMLGLIQADFPGQSAASFIPTTTQLGYAFGLLLILPLGDILNRRKLIITQFLLLSLAAVLMALAPTAWLLVGASLLLGAGATVAQQIIPFAASLAPPAKRGAIIGIVMAGLLSGILLSRTLSGFVGEFAGWRIMFMVAAPLALAGAGLMYGALPHHTPDSGMRYVQALSSLAHLWNRERDLRIATCVQALLFGSFMAFWSILALFLATPQYGLGADMAGLFGVLGAVGIFAAPLSGRVADGRGPHFVVWLGAVLTAASWLLFGTVSSLTVLVIGVVLLDFGIQSALVSNQHIIYTLDQSARSRLNTIFMTGMFLGGSAGSALASVAWAYEGWTAVCVLGGGLALAALGFRLVTRSRNIPAVKTRP